MIFTFSFFYQVQAITPQVSHAAKILLLNPNDPTALAYFNNVRDDYNKMMGQLVGLVDNATDAADFIQESGMQHFYTLRM